MLMNKPLLNIVIPVYNRLHVTQKTLLHLKKVKCMTNSVPFVITVVDNGSDEELRKKLIFFADEGIIDNLFILQKNMGISCACNIGWRAVDTDFFMKMDNDVVIHNTNFIEDIFKMYDLVEPFSNLGPAYLQSMIEESPSIRETPFGKMALCTKTLPGGALLIPKVIYNILGGFNEEYGLYGGDDGDYGVRMNFVGFKQYYYTYQKYFTMESTWGNSDYEGYDLDKSAEHRQLFQTKDGRIGLFNLNCYLYEYCIRSCKVPLRYEISDKNGYYTIVRERDDYKNIRAALERSTQIVDHSMRRSRKFGLFFSEKLIIKLKKIWEECGQEWNMSITQTNSK